MASVAVRLVLVSVAIGGGLALTYAGMTAWRAASGLARMSAVPSHPAAGKHTAGTQAAQSSGEALPESRGRGGSASAPGRVEAGAPNPPAAASPDPTRPPGSTDAFELFVPFEEDPALREALAELLESDDPAVRAEAAALMREWLGEAPTDPAPR